jgi:hypothetical protein
MPKIKGKHFPENQIKFSFNWKMFSVNKKYFSLINFSNKKQTHKILKNKFLKINYKKKQTQP